jgi:hypothetical protein
MFNTYCALFLFSFSSSCVPYVVNYSGLSFLIAPSVFSNVYMFLFCTLCCQFLWIINFWLLLWYSLAFICCVIVCFRLVYPMFSVSLDYPFSIVPSVFSNVYVFLFCLSSPCVPYVVSFSWLHLRYSLTFICCVYVCIRLV